MIFKNPYFAINGTLAANGASVTGSQDELSEDIRSLNFPQGTEAPDATVGGDEVRRGEKGLKTWSFSITLKQNFDATEVDAVLQAAFDSDDPVAVEFRPTSAAQGASNPRWTGLANVIAYTPVGQSVGDLIECTVELAAAGELVVSR